MCRIFARQNPESYALETRSLRLNGQGTSIRLEKVFWDILERIATSERLTLPRFLSTLHSEILEIRGEAPNFTSHLRCICIVFLERDPAARGTACDRAAPDGQGDPQTGAKRARAGSAGREGAGGSWRNRRDAVGGGYEGSPATAGRLAGAEPRRGVAAGK